MIKWLKKLFAKEVPPAPDGASSHKRHLLYLQQYFTRLKDKNLPKEDKHRYKYAIKDRQTRLRQAGLLYPENLEQCESMLSTFDGD